MAQIRFVEIHIVKLSPFQVGMDQILADIQSRTEAVRCDEIPWSDPILNLSMANYNIVFCLGLGLVAICSAVMILQPKTPTTS